MQAIIFTLRYLIKSKTETYEYFHQAIQRMANFNEQFESFKGQPAINHFSNIVRLIVANVTGLFRPCNNVGRRLGNRKYKQPRYP